MARSVRMGIDVGGTHTKAVAIDNATHEIIGKSSVKTTHDSKNGVADGVVASFMNCLKENNISPEEVVFVAHSTTQATNALIEGDVATVGIIGMGKGFGENFFARVQSGGLFRHDLKLDKSSGNKKIKVVKKFLSTSRLTEQEVEQAILELKEKGADVIVASKAFGVDDSYYENLVCNKAKELGLLTTSASEITKLYGLTRRTRTAAINASILPKMLNTANSTEGSVRDAGVDVPLMIMRGDGGVMEINEMRKRPVLTMLSGPAASVMGSLMYLRASNGIYFEVGGTTTNIGAIKNGRPAIDYSTLGGYKTYVSSLDVKVLGVAGGSMVRADKKGIITVGPRSAHIAGLDYAVFSETERIKNPKLEFFSPKPGDPSDYVRVALDNGDYVTITNSCAANVLGLVNDEHFSKGNAEAARKAMQVLADYCNTTVEDIAGQIMQKSYEKIEPEILRLIKKYKLEKDQISLVGVGGGAASLIIYFAEKMGIRYSIPENAEVISSIGVALAMVRDVVERVVPSPTKEDIAKIRTEAINKAIQSGATADSVEVHIEIDPQTSKITAIATGSTEVKTDSGLTEIDDKEALKIAAEDLRATVDDVEILSSTKFFYVIGLKNNDSRYIGTAIRIVDKKGFIRVQRAYAYAEKVSARSYLEVVRQTWESMAIYRSELIERPEYYLCMGARVMDFSSLDFGQLEVLMDMEVSNMANDDEVIVVAASAKN